MFRIKKYPRGYVVEIQKTTWYGKKYWTHYISVSGIDSEPWYHSEYKYAEMNLINKIKTEILKNNKL